MSKTIIIMFLIAAFTSLLAKLRQFNKNPEEIAKKPDGSIHWWYLIYITSLELVVGGVVGVGTSIALTHYGILSGDMLMLAVALSGIAGSKIFDTVQNRIHKKLDEDDDIVFKL